MRAVCSGTDGIGCCGWSDMAKPPEITAPTPLSTLRLTHSPTVSAPKWDSEGLRGLERSCAPVLNPYHFGPQLLDLRPVVGDVDHRDCELVPQPFDVGQRLGLSRLVWLWSLKRLSSVRARRLMGAFDFRLLCGRCQLYRCSQIGNAAARWSEVG